MALTVDPTTFVISIPKADLTLIQSSPTEVRELNLNQFRLDLKAWEAEGDAIEQGITFQKTHDHNTEVSLGGLTFARVIEILDPYSITFEDGQYAVNLVGANSNVGDKVNLNQVSVRSQNSAGLISSPDIEFASFNGGVTIDVTNGDSGTTFPKGTERDPVDNLTDALLIADFRGLKKLYIKEDMTLNSGSDITGFHVQGVNHVGTHIDIDTSADVTGIRISECQLGGVLDGDTEVEKCVLETLSYVNGHVHDCGLKGTITLGGSKPALFANCHQVEYDSLPVINMNTSGQDLVMTDYTGRVKITTLNDATGQTQVGIGLDHGQVELDSTTVTNGVVWVSGLGDLVDESGNSIPTGTWNTGVTVINTLLSPDSISTAVWDKVLDGSETAEDILEDARKKAKLGAFKL